MHSYIHNIIKSETFLCLLFLFIFQLSFSQDFFPEPGFLYSDEEVARIDITIEQAYLDEILRDGNEQSDIEYPASFKITRGIEVKTVDNIGFRLRGNTSRRSAKKSFKVSINTFAPGRSFYGVEKINLNGEHNDPSISRAKICWDLFRAAGVPAPRSNHVELYINDEYRGLYINVEHIDEEFVDLRFGNNDGNLYKCLYPADLNYLGTDPDLYKFKKDGRQAYELKTNSEIYDYSDLANLIDILNNTSPSDFPEFLEPVFNVNSYLKNLVVEILTGHWDAYSYNKNNYYLYDNELNDIFEFIPYDPDNTFGISWSGEDWGTRNIYNWYSSWEDRPMTDRLLENNIYKDRFSFYMNKFLKESFNPEVLNPKIESLRDKIAPFIVNDIYRTMDYGYNYNDFYDSFTAAIGDHVKYGLIPFVSTRTNSATSQLQLNDIAPIISRIQYNETGSPDGITITAMIEDEETPAEVKLYYNTGNVNSSVDMSYLGDNIYKTIFSAFDIDDDLRFHITAKDVNSKISREPYSGEYLVPYIVGIDNFQNTDFVRIFPNPFSSYMEISFGSNQISKLRYSLSDLSGKVAKSGVIENSELRIDFENSSMENGIYIIRLDLFNQLDQLMSIEYKKVIFIRAQD